MILTVSDGVAAGSREDRSGAVVAERLIGLGYAVTRNLVADEPELIAAIVSEAADSGTRLIISTGGTGLGPRDRTPEGVMTVVDYVVPGFGEVSAPRVARIRRWRRSRARSPRSEARP
jgi:molybdenum cofactor synthesis domain-containing protein